ncbi:hypothetical protein PG994_015363 [Apiospora phragmitis]|uniref:Uncharacterized protein n=1 Tax=Apiospora phragmitis TaxID=2905665 RepID=A0ABR1SRC3_9PEZI
MDANDNNANGQNVSRGTGTLALSLEADGNGSLDFIPSRGQPHPSHPDEPGAATNTDTHKDSYLLKRHLNW